MNKAVSEARIRSGQSSADDPRIAVEELFRAIGQPDTALVVFFCSNKFSPDALAAELNAHFGDTPVIGCTTAGEIGPAGYLADSISGFSLPASQFTVASGLIEDLQHFQISQGRNFTQDLLRSLEDKGTVGDIAQTFGFLLIDGLSIREEPVSRTIQSELGDIPMFGGSAGDGLGFQRTRVFHGGAFHNDAAVFTLINTALPFQIFKTQHFVCEEERLVVTEADPDHRIVYEINGLPAAEEYARLVGTDIEHLNPAHFAASPVVVVIDGTDYVRSIQKVNPGGSLTFYSAIDEGLVFRVARGEDLLGNLKTTLTSLTEQIGAPQLLITCDCILRNLEMSETGLKASVSDLLKDCHAVGFSTYGEQFNGAHVNQTLTGIAIGR